MPEKPHHNKAAPVESDKVATALKQLTILPKDEQMDLLAQALLREYMHKKKYAKTLATFDQENPRGEKTISSRAVMTDLMSLNAIQHRNKTERKENALATIMEMLCSYRLRKRDIRQHQKEPQLSRSGGSAAGEGGEAQQQQLQKEKSDGAQYDSSDEETEIQSKLDERKKLEGEILERQKEKQQRQKAAKKSKKDKKDKKKDESKKKSSHDNKSENTTTEPVAKAKVFDPLQLQRSGDGGGGEGDSSSLLALGSSSQKLGAGRNWLPTAAVPSVGLSTSAVPSFSLTTNKENSSSSDAGAGTAASASPRKKNVDPSENYKAPVFLAGDGMHLMAHRTTINKEEVQADIANEAAIGVSSPDVSPDHFRKMYNPKAQSAKGVLANDSSSGSPTRGGGTALASKMNGHEGHQHRHDVTAGEGIKPKKKKKTVRIVVAEDP